MKRNINSITGEMLGTARAVLSSFRLLVDNVNNEALDTCFDMHAQELRREINNYTQFNNHDIGDPVQLAIIILLMHGEETEPIKSI